MALLVLLLVLVIASSYVLVTNLNKAARRIGDYQATMQSLNLAKQALIGYAVNYYDTPSTHNGNFGILPCPDFSSSGQEGNQESPCPTGSPSLNVNSLGMLPWQTLGLHPLKDAAGQCLWYAVSGAYKGGSTKAYMVNEDSRGTFKIIAADGSSVLAGGTATARPVAVIFAPGPVLSYQDRIAPATGTLCGNDYTAAHFLDAQIPANPSTGIMNYTLSGSADAIDQFMQASDPANLTFNDVLVYITADEIINAVKKRSDYDDKLYLTTAASNLTKSVAQCITTYGSNHGGIGTNYSLPYPAPLSMSDYRVDSNYNDMSSASNLLSGRLPDIVDSSNTIINDFSQTNLITGCSLFTASAELMNLWKNWKDHLFYAVADGYKPLNRLTATPLCGVGLRCITISRNYPNNGIRDYAAIVTFSNSVIGSQSRNAPPIDTGTDEKAVRTNYRENLTGTNNTTDYTNTAGDDTKRYDYFTATATTFNDISYCINDDDANSAYEPSRLAVVECPKDCDPSQSTTCP